MSYNEVLEAGKLREEFAAYPVKGGISCHTSIFLPC
jgi:hypothetical protein